GTAAGCWDGGHLDLRAAVLLPLCAEAARRARGSAVSEAATALAGRAQSRRSPAPDCGCEESLPPQAAADSLRRGLAPQRSAPAQSPRTSTANGWCSASRSARAGAIAKSLFSPTLLAACVRLPVDATADLSLSRDKQRLACRWRQS